MKQIPALSRLFIALAFTATLAAEPKPATLGEQILGTWQLVSTKYGDAKAFSNVPDDELHIKMITATGFIWVIYDGKTREIATSMGGTYNLRDGAYTEKVEFYFPANMKAYLGKTQSFTIKIEGDQLTQTGKLSDGMMLGEVWRRVK